MDIPPQPTSQPVAQPAPVVAPQAPQVPVNKSKMSMLIIIFIVIAVAAAGASYFAFPEFWSGLTTEPTVTTESNLPEDAENTRLIETTEGTSTEENITEGTSTQDITTEGTTTTEADNLTIENGSTTSDTENNSTGKVRRKK